MREVYRAEEDGVRVIGGDGSYCIFNPRTGHSVSIVLEGASGITAAALVAIAEDHLRSREAGHREDSDPVGEVDA